MKSHEEEKRNSTRDFERFTGINLLGTDFLDSFILIDDKLSGNSIMLNRVASDVKKYCDRYSGGINSRILCFCELVFHLSHISVVTIEM